ncbi:hypothetical protein C8J57DRAFT_1253670 [Mycena rebaudengoi]|nr:hypothetical protein C8J57DRAFT_1253670 [Mycena rebaudengoi]
MPQIRTAVTQDRAREPLLDNQGGENFPATQEDDFHGLPDLEDSDSDLDDDDEPPADNREPPDQRMGSPEPPAVPQAAAPPANPVQQRIGSQLAHITHFGGRASALIRTEVPTYTEYVEEVAGSADNPWVPFTSQVDWEIAKWAKLRGSTSTMFTDLLSIDGIKVPATLGLSHKNSRELNKIIDDKLPKGRLTFTRQEIVVGNEASAPSLSASRRSTGIRNSLKISFLRPNVTTQMLTKVVHFYHEMNTAEWWWWWKTQALLPLSISFSTLISGCRKMWSYTAPSKGTQTGQSRDEEQRRCCAVLPPYLLDFFGGLSGAGLGYGSEDGECPTCPVPRDELGDFEDMYELQDLAAALDALRKADGNATGFTRAFRAALDFLYLVQYPMHSSETLVLVFSLTQTTLDTVFPAPQARPAKHLAYIKWFSKFTRHPEPNHLMYKISKSEERIASIISVIRCSVHLFPQFGPVVPRDWMSQNVYEMASEFYVNPWLDCHAYITIK